MILIGCVQKRLLYGLFACASWVLHLERGGGTLSVCMPQCVFQMEPGPGALKNPCLCHPISGLSQGAPEVQPHSTKLKDCGAPSFQTFLALHLTPHSCTQVHRYFFPSNIVQTSESVKCWCHLVCSLYGNGGAAPGPWAPGTPETLWWQVFAYANTWDCPRGQVLLCLQKWPRLVAHAAPSHPIRQSFIDLLSPLFFQNRAWAH